MVETEKINSIEEFEIGPIRPPSEGGSNSLLLRFTRNCSWNRCTFCYGLHYGREKLQLRSVEEIKRDIDRAKAIGDIIREKLGKQAFMERSTIRLLMHYSSSIRVPGIAPVL